jgi:hypothetical protein
MIIHPLPHRNTVSRIPLSVMDSAGNVEGRLGGICFADSPQPLLRIARRLGGTATIINGRGSTRWLRFEIGGTVYIPGTTNPSLSEVMALEEFAAKRGVEMAGLPKVAFNLFRSTIPGYCEVASGSPMPRGKFPPGASKVALKSGQHSNGVPPPSLDSMGRTAYRQ